MRKFTPVVISLTASLAFTPAALAQTLTGPARVIDGDTIVIDGTHIRLHGLDAPESAQTCTDGGGQIYACGAAATAALDGLLRGQAVTCQDLGRDRYRRVLARCWLANGTDIESWMVGQGYAIAYRHYSLDYAREEDAARAAHVGLWSGPFEEPYRYRREHGHARAHAQD